MITLPPIPEPPHEETSPADWARYLDILRLHVSAASADAIDRQTAQMALMTAAAEHNAALMQLFLDGKVTPHIHATYPLERAAEALNEVLNKRVSGKVVLVP